MKYHANQDNPNFPCLGVYSTSIMKVTSLVRILHSNASIHTTLLMTSVFAPTLFSLSFNNGLPQHCKKSLHLGNTKAQHQNATEQKKTNKPSCVHNVAKLQNFKACSQAPAVPAELANKQKPSFSSLADLVEKRLLLPSPAHFDCC